MNKKIKWDYKANKCIFIGNGKLNGIKGYRLYSEYSHQITISQSVIFHEDALLPSFVPHSSTITPTQLSYDFYESPLQPQPPIPIISNPIQQPIPSTLPQIVPSTPRNNELTLLSDFESPCTSFPIFTPPSPSLQH